MKGFFCLGGKQNPPLLPTFDAWTGSHLTSRHSGKFSYTTWDYTNTIAIPQRDKYLEISTAPQQNLQFEAALCSIDCDYSGPYRERLVEIQQKLPYNFMGTVNTLGDHGSLTILSNCGLHVWGLIHAQLQCAYLVWSDEATLIDTIRACEPLTYLVHRFPYQKQVTMHVHSQVICHRWWRWTSKHSDLFAFNALEKKIGFM